MNHGCGFYGDRLHRQLVNNELIQNNRADDHSQDLTINVGDFEGNCVTNLLILRPIGLCIEVVEGLIIIVVVAVVVHNSRRRSPRRYSQHDDHDQ